MEDNNNRKRKHGDTCKRRKGSQGKNWTKNTGYIDSYKQRHRRNMDYVKQLEKKVYTINTINIFEVFYFECF